MNIEEILGSIETKEEDLLKIFNKSVGEFYPLLNLDNKELVCHYIARLLEQQLDESDKRRCSGGDD